MPDRLKCPRCQLLLQDDEYEGHPVNFCNSCWGYWLTQDVLKKIIEDHTYHFSRAERRSVFETWRSRAPLNGELPEDPSEPINCPVCEARMARKHFAEDCPVVIDQCYHHGVWLDPGEIKELQIYVESR